MHNHKNDDSHAMANMMNKATCRIFFTIYPSPSRSLSLFVLFPHSHLANIRTSGLPMNIQNPQSTRFRTASREIAAISREAKIGVGTMPIPIIVPAIVVIGCFTAPVVGMAAAGLFLCVMRVM